MQWRGDKPISWIPNRDHAMTPTKGTTYDPTVHTRDKKILRKKIEKRNGLGGGRDNEREIKMS